MFALAGCSAKARLQGGLRDEKTELSCFRISELAGIHAQAGRLSVDRILIVGVETVAGANLAATLSQQIHVTGIAIDMPVAITDCQIQTVPWDELADPSTWLTDSEWSRVVFCGPASRSCWEPDAECLPESLPTVVAAWAEACCQQEIPLTMISSDARFTGPWMFHDEQSQAHCTSDAALCIAAAEQAVLQGAPAALVVRTNCFGWSPLGSQGWIEQRLADIEANRLADQDCIRHATPILATDLAGILLRAWEENLTGCYHIAGAERVNPLKFVQRLADHFELPWLSVRREAVLTERVVGFGASECSLQTKKLRKALCLAMPMLSEGLARLAQQNQNGYRDRLTGSAGSRSVERVA